MIETLMEEIKAVVSEKLQFGNWDESTVIAFFGNSGQSTTQRKVENEFFPIKSSSKTATFWI